MNLDFSKPEKIKQTLHDALVKIEKSNRYVLLDYPDNRNIGDRLIWLSNVFYLSDILKAKTDRKLNKYFYRIDWLNIVSGDCDIATGLQK